MTGVLEVYLCDIFAGKLHIDNSGRLSFEYDSHYLKDAHHLPLSVSMPLRLQPYDDETARAFFSGLLPEESILEYVAKNLKISKGNTFQLLNELGGECAGAVSLYPEGKKPEKFQGDFKSLNDTELKEILIRLKTHPFLADQKDMRLSLAGTQNKLPVIFFKDKDREVMGIPKSRPSSHILKIPITHFGNDVYDSIQNEFFCMQLAQKAGIRTPDTEIKWCEEIPYLLVSRYDRTVNLKKLADFFLGKSGYSYIIRLHQEDFCQALGLPPNKKYQNEGGPSPAQCYDLIEKYSQIPALDRREFIHRIIFNYLIGNGDAHGKNFSFLYGGNKPILAPAYDLLSTAVYPLNNKMAMKIGSQYDPDRVFLRHWHSLVENTSVAHKILEADLKHFAEILPILAHTLQIDLEKAGVTSPVFQKILEIIKKRSLRILKFLS